ncbi:CAunnamed protein product [Biomphalaria glabrata]|nr:CAunnamed protein product [Biomphalaria glabrata]
MSAAVAQAKEDNLLHRRTEHIVIEPLSHGDLSFEDNPEEEPLLSSAKKAVKGHPEQAQSIPGDGPEKVENVGDNVSSTVLEKKEKDPSTELKESQRTEREGTRKNVDEGYESIWLRGEMLGSRKREVTLSVKALGCYQEDEVKAPLIEPQEPRREPSLNKPKHTLLSRSNMLDESEYSKYWRGEVTVIKPSNLVNNAGIEVIPSVTPAAQNVSTLDQTMAASSITTSIIRGDSRLLLECIKQGENLKLICSKTGRSYLHLVALIASPEHDMKFVPMVYQLSNSGIDLDSLDNSGTTAVRYAVTRRLPQILAALLKCGAEFSGDDQYWLEQVKGVSKAEMMELVRRLTPSYWVAVHDATPFKVHRLVKSWSRVNISRNKLSLIEYAKKNDCDDAIIKLLLQNEASIELAHAVMAGDPDRTKVLLCHGEVDMDTRDASVKNNCFEPFAPLSLVGAAIKYDHVDVLKVLRNAKMNRKSYSSQRQPCGENTAAGGDNSVLIKRGHSYEGAGVSVFHYNSTRGGSLEFQPPELMTSSICDIL